MSTETTKSYTRITIENIPVIQANMKAMNDFIQAIMKAMNDKENNIVQSVSHWDYTNTYTRNYDFTFYYDE